MPLPSLDGLRCFLAAAKTLRFRAAAKAVALTPAAFGQRIKQLEEQVGAPLFARTTRSVSLTAAGASLIPVAERALAAAEDCLRTVDTDGPPVATEIVLGTRHELGMSWVLPERARLCAKRPWLGVHMYFSSGPDLLLRLRTHEIDCAITSSRPADPKLDALTLHREDYLLVASPALLRRVPLRRIADLADHTLVDISAELPLWRYLQDAVSADALPICRRASFLSCIAAMREEVLRGDGIAVLPAYFVASDLAARRLRRALPSVKLAHDHFRLVFRRGDARRPLFEGIADDLRASPLR